ncbi:MAG: outer membrane protein assembly factor BamA, partial [Desulfobacteraceae bacterium]|nr:outer membrane protein assembly factor BamA [Desulfobacteraceae bacterium]
MPFVIHGQEDAAKAQKSIDEVFSRLGSREGMTIVDPQEVRRAAGGAVQSEDQARSAGHRLGAAFALYGSFNQIGNAISIDAKLVDVSGRKKTVVLFAEEKGMENLAGAVGRILQQMSVNVLSKGLIAEVKVRGNDRIEAEAIKGSAKSKKGEVLKPEQVSEDIRAIYKMGFFEKVDAEVTDSPVGKILTFVVQENPTVQEVKVSGQKKIKEKDVLAAISSKPYTVLQRNVVSEDVQKIIKLYHQKGYYNADINSTVTFPKDPRKAVITFTIKENKKVYIKKIDFTGNKHFSARKLRGVMQTKQKSILSLLTDRGVLQRDVLETDTERITAFYHDEGYMDARVSSPEVAMKEDGFHISMAVEEGERYKVSGVSVSGDLLDNYEKKILKNLKLKPKAFFSREKVRSDIDLVTKAYMNEGYARVEVDPRIKRNPEEHATDINFFVTKNEVIQIGQIFVTGNTKTRDNVIRRELKIAEGETFSAQKIQDSITKLKKLDYFEDVEVTPTDTDDKKIMNLHVRVKEKMTGSISVGGGYSSDDGLFTSGTIMQKNLFGKGQYVALKGYLGQEAQRYMMSFTEPWMFGHPVSGGIDLYNWIKDYQDFTKDAYGFRVRSGIPFGKWSKFNVYYTFENAKITDLSAAAQASPEYVKSLTDFTLKSSISVNIERDTTDHPFLPTKGTYAAMTGEWSAKPLGSDSSFIRHEYKAGLYQPLFWKLIGHLRGMTGFMYEPDGDASVPFYEHFFLGGIDTLRGFEYAAVGPKNSQGLVVGGTKYLLATAEVLFPVVEKYGIRGVVF